MSSHPSLLALDDEISELSSSIAEMHRALQEKQERLTYVLDMRKKLDLALETAGEPELPAEIIGQIISSARFNYQDAVDRVFHMTQLRQVSPHWNSVVLGDPLFWKEATLMVASEHQWQTITAMHEARLLEHPDSTFGLHIICNSDSSQLLPEGVVKFVQDNVGRLSHFELRPGRMFYEILDQVNRGWDYHNYPRGLWGSLESLTVISPGTESYSYAMNVPLNDSDVPLLRTVTLGGWGKRDLTTEWMSLPFKQFTSITLRGFINPLYDYFVVLHECTNLQYLSIDITNDIDPQQDMGLNWNNVQLVALPSLTTLSLKTRHHCKLAPDFLQKLIVPSLTHLQIEDRTPRYPSEDSPFYEELFAELAGLSTRSSYTLHTLELTLQEDTRLSRDLRLAGLFHSQPTLNTIVLTSPALTCAFLNIDLLPLPPQLQSLQLTSLHPMFHQAQNNFSKWYHSRKEDSLKATLALEEMSNREVAVAT